jgi:hypothetical protein
MRSTISTITLRMNNFFTEVSEKRKPTSGGMNDCGYSN